MTFTLYCYGKFKPSDDKDDRHIDKVEVEEEDGEDRDVELAKPVNQYMASPIHKFEVMSMDD
jgi:hypothetical protein